MANRALSRTVIFLEKRVTAVPSNVYYERLLKGGRLKEILFTKNTTSQEMEVKYWIAFLPWLEATLVSGYSNNILLVRTSIMLLEQYRKNQAVRSFRFGAGIVHVVRSFHL